MVISLRSKRLALLFAQVWNKIPSEDQSMIEARTMLVVDSADFLPRGNRPRWGAAISIRLRKSISIIYLSRGRLPRKSDSFVSHIIARLLAHAYYEHIESDEDQSVLEDEANARASLWGYPVVLEEN